MGKEPLTNKEITNKEIHVVREKPGPPVFRDIHGYLSQTADGREVITVSAPVENSCQYSIINPTLAPR